MFGLAICHSAQCITMDNKSTYSTTSPDELVINNVKLYFNYKFIILNF